MRRIYSVDSVDQFLLFVGFEYSLRTLEFNDQLDEFSLVVDVLLLGVVELARILRGNSHPTRFCFSMSACNSASLLACSVLFFRDAKQLANCESVDEALGPCGSCGLSGVREDISSLIEEMDADVADC